MLINLINEYRVSVLLSPGEMEELGLKFETMRPGDVNFVSSLWLLKDRLREEGINVDLSGRLLIEAEENEKGVTLYFTQLSPAKKTRALIKRTLSNAVFRSENAEEIRRAAGFFEETENIALYEYDGTYFLSVQNAPEEETLRASEFADRILPHSVFLLPLLQEYGKALETS